MTDQSTTALSSKAFHHAAIDRPTTTELNDNDLKNEAALIERATSRALEQGITNRDIPIAAYVYNMMG